jgi:hypothetical protein
MVGDEIRVCSLNLLGNLAKFIPTFRCGFCPSPAPSTGSGRGEGGARGARIGLLPAAKQKVPAIDGLRGRMRGKGRKHGAYLSPCGPNFKIRKRVTVRGFRPRNDTPLLANLKLRRLNLTLCDSAIGDSEVKANLPLPHSAVSLLVASYPADIYRSISCLTLEGKMSRSQSGCRAQGRCES